MNLFLAGVGLGVCLAGIVAGREVSAVCGGIGCAIGLWVARLEAQR